jgi:hypothetical protein
MDHLGAYRLCFEKYQNKYEIINTETTDQNILDSDGALRASAGTPDSPGDLLLASLVI